jgi:diguanylate cyclase (GGDEF)-like protein
MPDDIRDVMLLSMFGSADVAIAGMACAMFTNIMEQVLLHNLTSECLLGVNIVLSAIRLAVGQRVASTQAAGRPTPTDGFLWSLAAWCLVQGVSVMVAVASNVPALQMVTFIIIMAVAGSYSVRQYATGGFILVLMAISYGPIMAGVVMSGNPWLLPLLPLVLIFAYSNYSMVLTMQTVTRDSLLAQQASYKLARHDSLTDALNRFGLTEALAAQRAAGLSEWAIFCLDLDGFKEVNDTRGHLAGDELLESVAQRLREAARRGDIVARLGGDEFLVLTPGMMVETAADFAEGLRRAVADAPHAMANGPAVRIGVSVGFACAPMHGKSFPELYHHADSGLYEAKQTNRTARLRWLQPQTKQA